MKITKQQLLALILVLKDSVSMNISGILFSISNEKRLLLLNEIINQQSTELQETE